MSRIFFNYFGALFSLVLVPAITCLCCQDAHASNETSHKHACCKENGTSTKDPFESNSHPLTNYPLNTSSYSTLNKSRSTHCDCLLVSMNINKRAIIAQLGVIDSDYFKYSFSTKSKYLSRSSKITSKDLGELNELLLFLTFNSLSHKDYFQSSSNSNPQQPRSPPQKMGA